MFGKSFFDKALEFADLLNSLQVVFLKTTFKNKKRAQNFTGFSS